MTRIPILEPKKMSAEQKDVYNNIIKDNGRVGFGPAIGYAYSAETWRLHSETSNHLLKCSLSAIQVRIISLLTVRHWKAAYPWSAQAKTALNAGMKPDILEALNTGKTPNFDRKADKVVYTTTDELLSTGTLSQEIFETAVKTLGYTRLVELVSAIGHFCTTAMMANVVGAQPSADAISTLSGQSDVR